MMYKLRSGHEGDRTLVQAQDLRYKDTDETERIQLLKILAKLQNFHNSGALDDSICMPFAGICRRRNDDSSLLAPDEGSELLHALGRVSPIL
jgi:hypothetical protein